MPTLIVAHSDALCNFLVPLLVGFSPAQTRHALNCIEALLVCLSKHKTLTALTRLLRLPHADEFALADFFRASPWEAEPVRQRVLQCLLQVLARVQQRTGWRLLFLRVDDALCVKDLSTSALEAVSLHYDHNRARRQSGLCSNSSVYVTISLQLGPVQLLLDWRLYLSRKVVKRLNRQREAPQRLSYTKLVTLVEQMLDEIAPRLPAGCTVYVLFDSWYDNQHLQKHIRAHAWHWICATRSNRVLSEHPLCHWWSHLNHQRITRVVVRSATRSHTYATRYICGRLRRYPDPVIALISKRKRRDSHPAYFLCSDTRLSVRTILKYYGYRWQAEVDNWFLKERFGLGDYRLHSVEAITRWHTLVFAAYAFIQVQRVQPWLDNPSAQLLPLGEVLHAHQREHARRMIAHIADLVRQGISDAELLAIFCPP
jgi:hypothetical protein